MLIGLGGAIHRRLSDRLTEGAAILVLPAAVRESQGQCPRRSGLAYLFFRPMTNLLLRSAFTPPATCCTLFLHSPVRS